MFLDESFFVCYFSVSLNKLRHFLQIQAFLILSAGTRSNIACGKVSFVHQQMPSDLSRPLQQLFAC